MIHWWTSGGESAAVKVFAEQFNKAGGTWVDTAIAGGANARTAAINRTVGGTPPTAMQFNTGKQFDELVENDLLNDVDGVATEQNGRTRSPAPIVDATTRNGKMLRRASQHPRPELAVLQHRGAEKAGAEAQDLGRHVPASTRSRPPA